MYIATPRTDVLGVKQTQCSPGLVRCETDGGEEMATLKNVPAPGLAPSLQPHRLDMCSDLGDGGSHVQVARVQAANKQLHAVLAVHRRRLTACANGRHHERTLAFACQCRNKCGFSCCADVAAAMEDIHHSLCKSVFRCFNDRIRIALQVHSPPHHRPLNSGDGSAMACATGAASRCIRSCAGRATCARHSSAVLEAPCWIANLTKHQPCGSLSLCDGTAHAFNTVGKSDNLRTANR